MPKSYRVEVRLNEQAYNQVKATQDSFDITLAATLRLLIYIGLDNNLLRELRKTNARLD